MNTIRHPRARFTRALGKICAALEASPIRDVVYKNVLGDPRQSRVQINALWVVGSYARGALRCGDLDLVLNAVSLKRGLSYARDIARTFFGATPRVAFYTGTPDQNSSGVVFPEAKLIWSPDQADWRSAIDSIAENPEASHFERPSDNLPLTPEQMRGDIQHAETLLRDRDEGTLHWYHVDFPGDYRQQPEIPAQCVDTFNRYGHLGQATRHALAHFLAASDGYPWVEDGLSTYWLARTSFRMGGTQIHIGRPELPCTPLENVATSRLVLVPHLTARGPNRAWVIERGENHPLVQQAENRVVYISTYSGKPEMLMEHSRLNQETPTLELFTSRAAAETFVDDMNLSDHAVISGKIKPAKVMELSGKILLDSIARAKRLEILDAESSLIEEFDMRKFFHYDADHDALFENLMGLLPQRAKATG